MTTASDNTPAKEAKDGDLGGGDSKDAGIASDDASSAAPSASATPTPIITSPGGEDAPPATVFFDTSDLPVSDRAIINSELAGAQVLGCAARGALARGLVRAVAERMLSVKKVGEYELEELSITVGIEGTFFGTGMKGSTALKFKKPDTTKTA